jgi:hypothetical protein
MFRKIFLQIYFIIVQPPKEWRVLADDEQEFEKFLSSYFHPLLGIITLAAFVGSFFPSHSIEMALKASILEFVTYFAGFYLSSFVLKKIIICYKYEHANIKRIPYFVVYASSPIYLISIISSLSDFQVIYIFLLYTFYIIWEGATTYMGIKEEKQICFSIISSLIVGIPYIIYFIINEFMLIR